VPKHCNLESFLDLLSATLAGGKPVLKLFDARTGSEVGEMNQIVDGDDYVAGTSRGRFKALHYDEIMDDHARAERNKAPRPPALLPKPSAYKAPKRKKKAALSPGRKSPPRERKPLELPSLTIAEKPRLISVVRNGDASVEVVKLLLTKRNTAEWDHLCQEISDKLQMGVAVRKMYTQDGVEITVAEDLLDGEVYVAAEKSFRMLTNGYEVMNAHSFSPHSAYSSSHSPTPGGRKRVYVRGVGDLVNARASLPAIGRAMEEANRKMDNFNMLAAADRQVIDDQAEQLSALKATMETSADDFKGREVAQTNLLSEMVEHVAQLKLELKEAHDKQIAAEANELALKKELELQEERNEQLQMEKQAEEKVAKRALQAKEDTEIIADQLSKAEKGAKAKLKDTQDELQTAKESHARDAQKQEVLEEQLEKAQKGWVGEMVTTSKARDTMANMTAELEKVKRFSTTLQSELTVQNKEHSSETKETHKAALRRFFDANNGFPHMKKKLWFTRSEDDIGKWSGLTIDKSTGRVLKMKVGEFGLKDTLSGDGLAQMPNMEELDFSHCDALKELPNEVGEMVNLQILKLEDCSSLQSLPKEIGQLEKLEKLDLRFCKALQSVPTEIGKLTNLSYLNLWDCGLLTEIPSEIGKCRLLKELDLSKCEKLRELPQEIGELHNLKSLNLWDCKGLTSLPSSIGKLVNLKEMNLAQLNLTSLPTEIGNMEKLTELDLSGCKKLQELPAEIATLKSLEELNLHWCKGLRELPAEIRSLRHTLRKLDVSGCEALVGVDSPLWHLTSVEVLDMSACKDMTAVPSTIWQLSQLIELSLKECASLMALPSELRQLTSLKKLNLVGCKRLMEFPNVSHLLPGLQVETYGASEEVEAWVARGCKPL